MSEYVDVIKAGRVMVNAGSDVPTARMSVEIIDDGRAFTFAMSDNAEQAQVFAAMDRWDVVDALNQVRGLTVVDEGAGTLQMSGVAETIDDVPRELGSVVLRDVDGQNLEVDLVADAGQILVTAISDDAAPLVFVVRRAHLRNVLQGLLSILDADSGSGALGQVVHSA